MDLMHQKTALTLSGVPVVSLIGLVFRVYLHLSSLYTELMLFDVCHF